MKIQHYLDQHRVVLVIIIILIHHLCIIVIIINLIFVHFLKIKLVVISFIINLIFIAYKMKQNEISVISFSNQNLIIITYFSQIFQLKMMSNLLILI